MKYFFKNNWFRIGILIISLMLFFGYFLITNQSFKEINKINVVNSSKEDLSFNIDLNSLDYKLPNYNSICIPNKKYNCSKDECGEVKSNVFILIDYVNNKFYRCDNKPCDQYPAEIEESGNFMNITPENPSGTIIKIAKGGDYFEVVSLGLDTLISYGTCSGK